MCGIAGIVARQKGFDLPGRIWDMVERVRHRGPDDEGVYIQDRVALGHRRLSIIDLTSAGHQPMMGADDRLAVVYNGEIYNHPELRSELEAMGYAFRTQSDTEVILTAYMAWGLECLSRFNGMWAFAIHDRKRDIIFAARDRFGVKPFYFTQTGSCFAFGSEIRQLLPFRPGVSADPGAIADFILTGASIQSRQTFFDGVLALLPGHFLVYDLTADRFTIERYYNLQDRVAVTPRGPPGEALPMFRAVFEEAISIRLRSDVRVGTCLSGGLDSSSIALLAAQMHRAVSSTPFQAITAISEDPGNNEEHYAAEVVRAGSLEWIKVRPAYNDFCDLLPHVVKHQEEPFNSASICMQAFVMRAARQHGIAVLLDGQGGDETLLGYSQYYPAHCAALWRDGGLRALWRGARDAIGANERLSIALLAGQCLVGLVPKARYAYYRLRTGYLKDPPVMPDWMAKFAAASLDIRKLQILEIETTMLPALLRYEDKNSMAYGIETRLPFLDYRLVEQAIALAPQLKIRGGWTKWVLREAMSDILPQNIAWRRNKIGFEAPADIWLRQHFGTMLDKVRQSPLISRFCNMDRLAQRYGGLRRNDQWRLYSLALWEEEFSVRA
jgi:asparagine synthase (glutamine-hydrolysing)